MTITNAVHDGETHFESCEDRLKFFEFEGGRFSKFTKLLVDATSVPNGHENRRRRVPGTVRVETTVTRRRED